MIAHSMNNWPEPACRRILYGASGMIGKIPGAWVTGGRPVWVRLVFSRDPVHNVGGLGGAR